MQQAPRRYLALWFPYLSCERMRGPVERPGNPAPPDPLVLVTRTGNALRLAAVEARAQALGLVSGMTLADARARCPALAVRPADPEADGRELDRLVREMVRFTPMVSADPPDGIILDITGCAHLLGGESELARQAVTLAGHTTRHAFAANAPAARALARHGALRDDGGEDVRPLPVNALELDEDALAALRRAGLRTLGDLARRPMRTLAARFGEETVTRLRQILGEVSSPLVPHRDPAPIRVGARFAEPLLRTDDALEVIEDLLAQAARAMEARKLGGRRFAVTLHRSDNARRRLTVETGQPVRDPQVVLRLLRERIETLADPLDPGFGFDAIDLAVLRTEPLHSRQMALEGREEERSDGLSALMDRLSVRLGAESVRRLTPCDRHLPEGSQALEPAMQGKAVAWPAVTDRMPRPILLFDPPQPVEAVAGVPDGPPQRFRWQGRLHDVRLAEGPERIGSEWWRLREGHLAGKGGLTRDYYRVEDAEGRRYWIFRHGLFDEKPDPRWYLHGLFA
ncbi:MAG TPA: DNA polymerase Y family protein [Novosphingobium sp.]|nr:DNA polymerase Y family protein [Novosphingobium sp.]